MINILAKNSYFFPTPKFWNHYSLFFYFRKICSHHHCYHFHLRFCWVVSIGWGRWFFVKNLEKEEFNMKHFWCGIGWRVFISSPTLGGGGLSWPEYLPINTYCMQHLHFEKFQSHWRSLVYQYFLSFHKFKCGNMIWLDGLLTPTQYGDRDQKFYRDTIYRWLPTKAEERPPVHQMETGI